MDYYNVLGLERSATKEEIKKQFRKLSMQYHPDKNPGDPGAENKFKELNEAYSVLSDDKKRAEYDNPVSGFFGSFNPFAGFGRNFHRPQQPNRKAPADGKLLSLASDLPLRLFLFGGQFKATISFHEGCELCDAKGFTEYETCPVCSGNGIIQRVESRPGFQSIHNMPCSDCGGSGMRAKNQCPNCKGTGNVLVENKEFVFNIPEDIKVGQRLILNGVGRSGINGGRRGDVVLFIDGIDKSSISEEQRQKIKEALDNAA